MYDLQFWEVCPTPFQGACLDRQTLCDTPCDALVHSTGMGAAGRPPYRHFPPKFEFVPQHKAAGTARPQSNFEGRSTHAVEYILGSVFLCPGCSSASDTSFINDIDRQMGILGVD